MWKKFSGLVDYVVNFFYFIVVEMCEMMVEFGFRSLIEIIGYKEFLIIYEKKEVYWKVKYIDFLNMFYSDDFYKN